MIPRAGSAYTYGYVALGEIVGWFIGWDLLLEYIAIVGVVAIGIASYLTQFLGGIGIHLPAWMLGTADQGGVINLPAILICLLVTFILSRGTKTLGRFEIVAVGLKILLILFIVGLGVFYVNPQNYTPFMPNGFGSVFAGAATVFFAVFGYDAMSTAAEESTDGKKHMPKAIILSLIIAMALYFAATLVLTGMQNWTQIDTEAGFAVAFTSVGLPIIATVISAFAVISIMTVMLTFLLGVTRVWTPQRVTWIAGVAAAVLAGVFPIRLVADLTNIGILSAFVVVCIAVIALRYTKPDIPRTFKLPGMPFIPAFGVLASAFLITQLHYETWIRFGVWLIIGLAVYFGYSRHHSVLNPDRKVVEEG